ncbi:hypothetical protein HDV00_010604 [Rhizophlyctis rosea]|nr:hypothetical protein HDV00_010604 [Rhizophlyctis rosea]
MSGRISTLLKEQPTVTLFANLRKAARGIQATFCCGGTIQPRVPTKLWYENGNGGASTLVLPIKNNVEVSLKPLLSVTKNATFGRGGEEVNDTSYRSALQLEPSQFATSFDLSSYTLLDEIRNIMMPNHSSIRAHLYKLNVYGKGHHFKPHVDTPVGEEMFGSLVVCLPVPFEGEKLTIEHGERMVEFDWGKEMRNISQKSDTPIEAATSEVIDGNVDGERGATQEPDAAAAEANDAIRWAAFYSDCTHTIAPIQSGHRLTFTYNLYSTPAKAVTSLQTISPTTFPIHSLIQALLRRNGFLPPQRWSPRFWLPTRLPTCY